MSFLVDPKPRRDGFVPGGNHVTNRSQTGGIRNSITLPLVGRRWGAMLAITLALLVVAVISSASRSGVPGSAAIAPPPGPPSVGACVTETLDDGSGQAIPDVDLMSHYPSAVTAACTGRRFGEVAGVIAQPQPLVTTAVAVTGQSGPGAVVSISAVDPNTDTCRSSVNSFIGAATASDGIWTDAAAVTALITAPSDRQQAAGQHWLACIAEPITGPGSAGYSVSLRNAFRTGYPAADAISSCGRSSAGNERPSQADCGSPHDFEIFGFRQVAPAATEQDLAPSCLALIKDRMRSSDPTGAGRLTDAVAYFDAEGNPRADYHGAGSAQCLARTTDLSQKLTHSLLGLADRSVPLTEK